VVGYLCLAREEYRCFEFHGAKNEFLFDCHRTYGAVLEVILDHGLVDSHDLARCIDGIQVPPLHKICEDPFWTRHVLGTNGRVERCCNVLYLKIPNPACG